MFWLRVADISLIGFHTALIVFNCLGWAWQRTRRLHLGALGATAASWLVLGIWFGPGYCVCTDLQWRVRAALGEEVAEHTYIQFLVHRLTGWTPPAALASNATLSVFMAMLVLSLRLNLRDWSRKRHAAC